MVAAARSRTVTPTHQSPSPVQHPWQRGAIVKELVRKDEKRRGSPAEKQRTESARRKARQSELAELRRKQAAKAKADQSDSVSVQNAAGDDFEAEDDEEMAVFAPGSATGSQGSDLMSAKRKSQSRQSSPVKPFQDDVPTVPGSEIGTEQTSEEAALLRDELESALLEFGGDLSSLPTIKPKSRSPSPARGDQGEHSGKVVTLHARMSVDPAIDLSCLSSAMEKEGFKRRLTTPPSWQIKFELDRLRTKATERAFNTGSDPRGREWDIALAEERARKAPPP